MHLLQAVWILTSTSIACLDPLRRAAHRPPRVPSPKAMTQTVADVGEPGMGTIEFDLSKITLDAGGPGKTEPRLGLGDAPSDARYRSIGYQPRPRR
jgi:hypothetical protein